MKNSKLNIKDLKKSITALSNNNLINIKGGLGDPPPFGEFNRGAGDPPPFGEG